MNREQTVLVPLDGSPLSERSLPYATSLASALNGRLVLMMAAYISDIPEHGPWSGEMVSHPHETCMAYLTGIRKQLGAPDADLIVKVGYPHEAILEAAAEVNVSVIVASTHGRSGLGRWMYGSTAGHLLHTSRIPLLVVGKNVGEPQETGFAPRSILVPLDGSSLAEQALPLACQLAKVFTAGLSLVRVAPLSVEAFPMMVPQVYWPNLDTELVAGAQAYLERINSSLDVSANVKVLQGPRADTLLAHIERTKVDLVVMATHGRAGVQRALLGSTADRMLGGTAPVLLIRPE